MSRVLVGLRGSGIIGHTVPESGIRLNAPAVRPQEEWEKDVLASAKGKGKANGSTTRTGKGGGIPLVSLETLFWKSAKSFVRDNVSEQ